MLPPVGGGMVMMIGNRKHIPASRMRKPAGTHSRSVRLRPCMRSRRLLTRGGSSGGAPGIIAALGS